MKVQQSIIPRDRQIRSGKTIFFENGGKQTIIRQMGKPDYRGPAVPVVLSSRSPVSLAQNKEKTIKPETITCEEFLAKKEGGDSHIRAADRHRGERVQEGAERRALAEDQEESLADARRGCLG